MALVDKAAALIDSKGKAAFTEFRNAGSECNYGYTYLFVNDLNGKTLFHGSLPELEGTSVLGLKDSNGKFFIVEMVNVVKSKRLTRNVSGMVYRVISMNWVIAGSPTRSATF